MMANEQEWKELLSHIGLSLRSKFTFNTNDEEFYIVDPRLPRVFGIFQYDDIFLAGWFSSIDHLERCICKDGSYFLTYKNGNRHVKFNPWQGCRSLEEIRIKTDLYCGDECIQ